MKRVFYSEFVWKCIDMCKHRFGVQLLKNPPFCSSTFQTRKNIDKFGSQRTGRSFVRKLCCVFNLCRSREEQKPLFSKTRGLYPSRPLHGLYQSKPGHFTDYFIGGGEKTTGLRRKLKPKQARERNRGLDKPRAETVE